MLEVIFNGRSSKEFDLIVSDWKRPIFADLLDEYLKVEGRHGYMHLPKAMGDKIIEVQFKRINNDVSDWLQTSKEIAAWLYTKDEKILRFDDEPHYYIGKVAEAPNPDHERLATEFWVTFRCHPFKYGEEKILESEKEVVKVINDGTASCPYKLTLNIESIPEDELLVTINDVAIKYDGDLEVDDVVTIDTDQLELRVNDELKVLEVSGYFCDFETGENIISINVDAKMRVEWQELYL